MEPTLKQGLEQQRKAAGSTRPMQDLGTKNSKSTARTALERFEKESGGAGGLSKQRINVAVQLGNIENQSHGAEQR